MRELGSLTPQTLVLTPAAGSTNLALIDRS